MSEPTERADPWALLKRCHEAIVHASEVLDLMPDKVGLLLLEVETALAARSAAPGTNTRCPRCGFVTSNVFDCPTCKGGVNLNAAPPSPCCGNFADCQTPCVPRAEHWKALALSRAWAPTEDITAAERAAKDSSIPLDVAPAADPVAWINNDDLADMIDAMFQSCLVFRCETDDRKVPLYNAPPDLQALERDRDLYHELIMAVASKYPGETRHETALRYINERETSKSTGNSMLDEQRK